MEYLELYPALPYRSQRERRNYRLPDDETRVVNMNLKRGCGEVCPVAHRIRSFRARKRRLKDIKRVRSAGDQF